MKAGETIWDASLTGFGARRQKSDAVAYVLFYRTKEGRQRWFTIGRHGAPWTPETAREEARRLLGDVAHQRDPASEKRRARNAQTVAELCDLYFADAEAGRLVTRRRTQKKASTFAIDKGRIARHIKPLLGQLRVAAVTREDVECFMHDVAEGKTAANTKTRPRGLARVRGGKGAANRAVGLLGAIFSYAARRGMRSDNPVHGVVRQQMAGATGGSPMPNIRHWARRCGKPRLRTSGPRQSQLLASSQLAVGVRARHWRGDSMQST
jgi:hypothetical protein